MSKKYRFQVPVYHYYEAEANDEYESLDKICSKNIKPSMVEDGPNWVDAMKVTDESIHYVDEDFFQNIDEEVTDE